MKTLLVQGLVGLAMFAVSPLRLDAANVLASDVAIGLQLGFNTSTEPLVMVSPHLPVLPLSRG